MAVVFNKLMRNLQLNEFSNVVAEKIALSNENRGNEALRFYANWPLNSNSPGVLHPIHGGHLVEDSAPIVTLDSYVRSKAVDRIDFIKLDVDGYEYKILQGGVNAIKKFKPVMVVEFGSYTLKECGDSLEKLIDLLNSLDYSFYSEEDLQRYNNKQALLNAVPPDATINVLCKPESGWGHKI